MKIEKCQHKVKCDLSGCGNFADYYITKRGFIRNEFALCEKCLHELYDEAGKLIVPKPIESRYKRRKNLEEEVG